MSEMSPRWQQRLRAPQIKSWSLLGPAVSWARDQERGVLLANPNGRFEVYAFDASLRPAQLRQVSDRPQGTIGCAIAPDGNDVFWFDDRAGDELGRWRRQPFAGGTETVLLEQLPPAYGSGIVTRRGGGAVVGRGVEAGFELAVASPDGGGAIVYRSPETASLCAADDEVAAISHPPDGDLFHPIARIVDLSDGRIVAELDDDGLGLEPIAFSPGGDRRLLVRHSRHDRTGLLIWSPDSGAVEEVIVDLEGDVTGTWLPDASGLLLVSSLDGRDSLSRLDLASGSLEHLDAPRGVIDEWSPRNDGSVQALVESAQEPPRLVEIGRGPVVVLDGEAPAPSVPAESIDVVGPAGRVQAFLHRPEVGSAPFPTVFAVHGGPTAQDVDSYRPLTAALVDAGYAVVRVNYRGSTGYGRAWRDALVTRLGAIELEDIAAVRASLEADGIIDSEKVAMVGGSWGGFMTLFALGTEPDRWSAGVALVPLADFAMSQEDQPAFMTAYDHALFGGTLEEMPDEYRAASPLTYVDDVRSPVLITAGANDPRCPPRPTDTYVERLRERDHDVVYIRKDTGHASYDNERLVDEIGLMLEFLESRLPAR
jgi:dipeptidyl aminopeptidase/acylaminoacyl peptidase